MAGPGPPVGEKMSLRYLLVFLGSDSTDLTRVRGRTGWFPPFASC